MGLGYNMMGFGPMGWFGIVFTILFWILLIGGIIMLIKMLAGEESRCCGRRGKQSEGKEGKMDILTEDRNEAEKSLALKIIEERYAKGEIDKWEFEQKKKDLCE